MANKIHPTAMIGDGVALGDGNDIGPGCVLEDGVVLGARNRLWMNVYVGPGTTIGDDNQLHMGAVIGHLPQDLAFAGGETFTNIGHRNTIREYVTIHRGTKDGTVTILGDDNFLMANAHVAHNCRVGSGVIMVNVAALGGHGVVEDGAFLSGMVGMHQFTRIGRLAMIGAFTYVMKDVPPYMLCAGRPAAVRGLNVVGMRRAGIKPAVREDIKLAYKRLYRDGLNVTRALEAIERECVTSEARAVVDFVRHSKRGICAGIGSDEAPSDAPRRPRKPSRVPA